LKRAARLLDAAWAVRAMISLFAVLIHASGYLTLLIAALCMACGLYYLAELAEEHTSLAKKFIRHLVHFQLFAHAVLLVYERFPLTPVTCGAVAHCAYYAMLRRFPFIEPLSMPAITAMMFFLASNAAWFSTFRNDIDLLRRYEVISGPSVSAFFALMVWTTPIALFVSLTLNDAMLPGSGELHGSARHRTSIIAVLLAHLRAALAPLLHRARA